MRCAFLCLSFYFLLQCTLFSSEFLPPLPLYPDSRISLSKESKKYLNSQEYLEKEQARILQVFAERKKVYDGFLLSVFIPLAAFAIFWISVEYNLSERIYKILTPKKNILSELMNKINDPKAAPDERWLLLSKLARAKIGLFELKDCMNMTNPDLAKIVSDSNAIPPDIKIPLENLISKLDLFCFSPLPQSDEEWQKDKNFLIDINISNTHCSGKRNDL